MGSRAYTVRLVNANKTIAVGKDETIYDAAKANGIQLPIGCRYGGCMTCAAKIIDGKVRQPGATALNKWQSQKGFILLCVAIPCQDCVIVEGVDIQDSLFRNPFAQR